VKIIEYTSATVDG